MGEASDQFELSDHQATYVDKLAEQYETAIGKSQRVLHIVPKSLWLHKYADHVISIPPAGGRDSWLYGTLLISALSDTLVELVLERPREDTIGGVGTLAKLIQYYLENGRLDEWHTIGVFPFFGESSSVRGLLFCQPPDYLPNELHVNRKVIKLLYVAGITEDQLAEAQSKDDERGEFLGTKRLYADLGISSHGIAHLAN